MLPSPINVMGETSRTKGYGLQAAPGVKTLGRARADRPIREGRGPTLVPSLSTPDERHPPWPELDNSSLHELSGPEQRPKPRPLSPRPDDWVVSSEEGRPLVLYLDFLPVLAKMASTEDVASLLERYGALMPTTFSIISAVVI